MNNPWGLNPYEFQTMQSLTKHGSTHTIAKETNRTHNAVMQQVNRITKKMECKNRHISLLLFDRWYQARLFVEELSDEQRDRINWLLALKLQAVCKKERRLNARAERKTA